MAIVALAGLILLQNLIFVLLSGSVISVRLIKCIQTDEDETKNFSLPAPASLFE